jgi:uncharacterized protein CbrC (UPF0167 family)
MMDFSRCHREGCPACPNWGVDCDGKVPEDVVECGCCGRKVGIHTTTKVGVSEECWEYICPECLS